MQEAAVGYGAEQGRKQVKEPIPRLLIVEDDPWIAKAVCKYAKIMGYSPRVAHDGLVAIGLAEREQPDVILLDIALPGLDGRDVLVRLQEAGIAQQAVVIFLTGRSSQSDRLMGLELGAEDYETKPMHLNSLFSKIERLLEKKRCGEI